MSGTINNRRQQHTKQVIKESFFALLHENDLSKITVKAIAEQADINRGTFYNYYSNPNDLYEKIQQEYIQNVLKKITVAPDYIESALVDLLTLLKEDPILQALALEKQHSDDFIEQLLTDVKAISLHHFAQNYPHASTAELELYFAYATFGAIGVIKKWLVTRSTLSPEEVAHQLLFLFSTNIQIPTRQKGLNH